MTFLWFSNLFLDCFLKLIQFLAQLHKRVLCRIWFLSTIPGGAEIGLFHSILLIFTTIFCVMRIMCIMHIPMFLAEVPMLLSAKFLWDSGHRLSTRLLVSFLALVGSFLVGLGIGLFLCTYTLNSLEWHKKQTDVNGSLPFLWRLNWSCHVSGHIQWIWLARLASANGTFMGIVLGLALEL